MALDERRAQRARETRCANDGDASHGASLRAPASSALDPPAHRGDLVVGERAVGRAELEPQRERLVPLAHLLAAIDVEQPHALEQLTAGRAHGRLDVGVRDVLGHDDRDVLDHGRERRHRPVPGGLAGDLGERVRIELERGRRVVEVPRARDQRVQLADPADLLLVADQHARRAARVQERAARPARPQTAPARVRAGPRGLPSRRRSRPQRAHRRGGAPQPAAARPASPRARRVAPPSGTRAPTRSTTRRRGRRRRSGAPRRAARAGAAAA